MSLRTLILEDSPVHAELMVYYLRGAGFKPEWERVETEPAYLTRLDRPVDLILADYFLPHFTAVDALRLLRERGLDVPFIVVSGGISEEVAVECVKQGAADYVLKDRLARLPQAVSRALEEKRLRDERRQAEERLRASLKEKEVLLKEVHHRVKNNLQVISSLLNLQSKQLKDPRSLEIFEESRSRIRSMGLIHEQLYRSKDLARIDFGEYLESLGTHTFRSYGVNPDLVTLKVNAEGVSLGIDTAIPCALLISELLSNALKYAFLEGMGGEIRIDLVAEDGKVRLRVSDNGIGFPEHLDFRSTESLGLQLVVTLADQVGASIELDRSGGTTFTIVFDERARG